MFSVLLIQLLAAGSCVYSIDLIQPDSLVVQPGQSLTITCQVSGYSLTDDSYATGWIRQREGKLMDWISHQWGTSGLRQNDALKNKFGYSRDTSARTVTITGQNVQPEDTAVYYCVRLYVGSTFDYWGKGTEVTVSSASVKSPTVFPLVACQPGSGDKITVGCLANDFFPKTLTFQWTNAGGAALTSAEYPTAEKNNKYTAVSLLEVSQSDWDSMKSFKCNVTHQGSSKALQMKKPDPPKMTLVSVQSEDKQALICTIKADKSGTLEPLKWKKNDAELTNYMNGPVQSTGELQSAISVLEVSQDEWEQNHVYTCETTYKSQPYKTKISNASITVMLKQPKAKTIFHNRQAEIECVITGQDKTTVDNTDITWQINGGNVASSAVTVGATKSGDRQFSKTSTMTRSVEEWLKVDKVRCSAERNDRTPVIQDLTVHKGDGSEPKVTVHILPKEFTDQENSAEVTLVCLVSSPVQQDYYIAWSEHVGNSTTNYVDGVNFLPEKTKDRHLVTSVYTISKTKWDENKQFYCNVWPAGRNKTMRPKGVSKIMECLLDQSCPDDVVEEDEFSSLWSTASSFIFLFISSLFYNIILSLVKMKRH